jgi:N-acetylneuraminate lyase
LIKRFETKDLEGALHLQEKSIDLISLYPRYGGAATGKAILKITGIDCGDFRPPGKILSDNQRKELWADLQQQSFFNYSAKS